jgi:hypothetical protein
MSKRRPRKKRRTIASTPMDYPGAVFESEFERLWGIGVELLECVHCCAQFKGVWSINGPCPRCGGEVVYPVCDVGGLPK